MSSFIWYGYRWLRLRHTLMEVFASHAKYHNKPKFDTTCQLLITYKPNEVCFEINIIIVGLDGVIGIIFMWNSTIRVRVIVTIEKGRIAYHYICELGAGVILSRISVGKTYTHPLPVPVVFDGFHYPQTHRYRYPFSALALKSF